MRDTTEFNELVFKYYEGDLRPEEREALLAGLRGDAERQRFFIRESVLRAAVHEWSMEQVPAQERPSVRMARPGLSGRRMARRAPERHSAWPLAAAAGVLIAAGALAFFALRPAEEMNTAPEGEPRAVAKVASAEGTVRVTDAEGRTSVAATGQTLMSGQRVDAGPDGAAVIVYADGSQLDVRGGAGVTLTEDGKSQRVFLHSGALRAEIHPQPAGGFALSTELAEARVVGTQLRMSIEAEGTRLEVQEGKVDFKRIKDGAAASVNKGEYAVAGPKIAPVAMAYGNTVWYAAPEGLPGNAGTRESPWDIHTAVEDARKAIKPGDTVILREGTYRIDREKRGGFAEIRLVGTADRPITVRGEAGRRATIDGSIAVMEGSAAAHVRVMDLEVRHSEYPAQRSEGSGVFVNGGRDCRFINLVIHDNHFGIAAYRLAADAEFYGCILYDNGTRSDNPGTNVVSQNLGSGMKRFTRCIMSSRNPERNVFSAWASDKSSVENYLISENIFEGPGRFLLGGSTPGKNFRFTGNWSWKIDPIEVGWGIGPQNEDCAVLDNVVLDGNLRIYRFRNYEQRNNMVTGGRLSVRRIDGQEDVIKTPAFPSAPKAALWTNAYDPGRAHLASVDQSGAGAVSVAFDGFLRAGEAFRMMDPKDPYGRPVHAGIVGADGRAIVPLKDRFNAYLVLKGER
jgi:hypothetical protein